MQHLYGLQSSANTNTSATNIPAANTSSTEFCSITTDDISLSNDLQNAMSAVSVIQTTTSKTAKEFEFGYLHNSSFLLFILFQTAQILQKSFDEYTA
jgi:hypothetical protein